MYNARPHFNLSQIMQAQSVSFVAVLIPSLSVSSDGHSLLQHY